MSTFLIIQNLRRDNLGDCEMCGNETRRIYTMKQGGELRMCSEECLLDATVPQGGDRADGVMTEEQVEASMARRTREMAEEAGQGVFAL